MQYIDQSKTLFQLTTELTDKKVEVAVATSIKEAVDQIIAIKLEMRQELYEIRLEIHDLRLEMHREIKAALETALGQHNQNRTEIRTRLYDFAFKCGWILFGSTFMYIASYFHLPPH